MIRDDMAYSIYRLYQTEQSEQKSALTMMCDPVRPQGHRTEFSPITPDRMTQENICNFPVIIRKGRGSWGPGPAAGPASNIYRAILADYKKG